LQNFIARHRGRFDVKLLIFKLVAEEGVEQNDPIEAAEVVDPTEGQKRQ
jgi:hypothetical protein